MLFRAGDIAACYGTCWESRVIRWGTASLLAPRGLRLGPSHVAMLAHDREFGLTWFESTSLCKSSCLIRKTRVRGAQAQHPIDRIGDYTLQRGWVEIYRPTRLWELTADESARLADRLRETVEAGLNYDLGGALLSGTRCLKFARFLRADLDSLFCSELIAAALQVLGRLCPQNPMHFNPAMLLRRLVRSGVYRRVVTFFPGGHSYDPSYSTLRLYDPELRCAA